MNTYNLVKIMSLLNDLDTQRLLFEVNTKNIVKELQQELSESSLTLNYNHTDDFFNSVLEKINNEVKELLELESTKSTALSKMKYIKNYEHLFPENSLSMSK